MNIKISLSPIPCPLSPLLSRRRRSGSALILVLVVIAMLSLGAYTFSELMITEYRAATAAGHQQATLAWAESGIEYTAALLTADGGGWEADLHNNPVLFHVPMEEGGGFTIVAPLEDPDHSALLRMGVIDESAKINLNAIARLDPSEGLARNLLMGLPNMTEEIADSILDWIDGDTGTREFGAEAESDALLLPRDAPLQSLEELLLLSGVTAELLYGEDANRNGVLDPNENDGDLSMPHDNADGVLNFGWSEYLTLYSKESNLQHSADEYRQPRLNVNETLLTDLYDELEERIGATEALFITAYRLNGPLLPEGAATTGTGTGNSVSTGSSTSSRSSSSSSSGSNSSGGSSSSGSSSSGSTSGTSGSSSSGGLSQSSKSSSSGTSSTGNSQTDQALQGIATGLASALGGAGGSVTRGGLDVSSGGSHQINSIYDLIGAQVNATINGQATVLESPWKSDPGSLQQALPLLLDRLTTTADTEISGRININQARREVLLGIPGMPEGVPDAIITARSQRVAGSSGSTGRFATAGWLLIEGLVDLETMRKLDSSITGQGGVVRVQVIGHGDKPGPMARLEAIIDGTQPVPTVIYQRNLSDLGAGYRRDQLPSFSDSITNSQNNR